MKNKKTKKYLLSGIVLISVIILNVNHCSNNIKSSSLCLGDVFKVTSCKAEAVKDTTFYRPVLRSPGNPDDGLSEEDYWELLRRKRK